MRGVGTDMSGGVSPDTAVTFDLSEDDYLLMLQRAEVENYDEDGYDLYTLRCFRPPRHHRSQYYF